MNYEKPTKSEIASKSKQSRSSKSLQAQASHLLAKAFPKEYGKDKIKVERPRIYYGRNF